MFKHRNHRNQIVNTESRFLSLKSEDSHRVNRILISKFKFAKQGFINL